MTDRTAHQTSALIMAFLANFILGISSIYWHLFAALSPITLVFFRIILSFAVLSFVLIGFRPLRGSLRTLGLRTTAIHVGAALLVAINWATFIWASINGAVMESGIGYLVAPVFTMIAGILLQGERLYPIKGAAIFSIAAALMALIVLSGHLDHWVYWTIGITWGGYTVLKKKTPLNPISGLFVETAVLLALTLAISFIFKTADYTPHRETLFLYPALTLCGIISVTPLFMFSYAARKLDAYSMGALQFVLPTTQLILSIFYYQRDISSVTYLCFAVIWIVVGFATYVDIKKRAVSPAWANRPEARHLPTEGG